MQLTLIINSVACVVVVIAGLLAAVACVVSGIGAWLVSSTALTIGLIGLPWVYGVVFILLMLVSFRS